MTDEYAKNKALEEAKKKAEEKNKVKNTAEISAVTGPDRRVNAKLENITQVTFNLLHKVVDVTLEDGHVVSYDMGNPDSASVTLNDKGFDLKFTAKEEKKNDGTSFAPHSSTPATPTHAPATPATVKAGTAKA
jgi:hypothetical protein